MKRHISREEWYPVLELRDKGCYPEEIVDVPDDVIERYERAMDAIHKSQAELETYWDMQPQRPFDPAVWGIRMVSHENPFRETQ